MALRFTKPIINDKIKAATATKTQVRMLTTLFLPY